MSRGLANVVWNSIVLEVNANCHCTLKIVNTLYSEIFLNDADTSMCPQQETEKESIEFVKQCDTIVMITGDLTFHASVLGKVKMSGK